MKLFIDIVMKRIYLFNIVAWNYRKKIGFPVCKKENFAGLQAHRKRGKSARASQTPHHTLNEERSACFTAQPLSAQPKTLPRTQTRINRYTTRSVLQSMHISLIRSPDGLLVWYNPHSKGFAVNFKIQLSIVKLKMFLKNLFVAKFGTPVANSKQSNI